MLQSQIAAGAASILITLAMVFPAHSETACWQPYEVEAARVRDLQTLMLMGALKCGNAGSAVEAGYNNFVAKNRNTIINNNNILKAHFMRDGGISGGQEAYDKFVTGLANSHSARAQSGSFCEVSNTLMTLAQDASESELATLARNFADQPEGVGETCRAEDVVPANQVVTAAVAPAVPAVAPAVQPPATPQSAAAALEAAAVAMQAAATALKEQQAAMPAAPTPVNAPESELTPEVVQPAPVVPPSEPLQ